MERLDSNWCVVAWAALSTVMSVNAIVAALQVCAEVEGSNSRQLVCQWLPSNLVVDETGDSVRAHCACGVMLRRRNADVMV